MPVLANQMMKILGKFSAILVIVIVVSLIQFGCRKAVSTNPPKPDYIQLQKPFGFPAFISLKNNDLTEQGVMLGRMLFYDPILSEDSTQSCSSCHHQSAAFTDPNRRFSIGINGNVGKRNSMALFNLNWHVRGFFWDGRAATLQEQALMPIEDPAEMASSVPAALKRINGTLRYKQMFYKAFGVKEATGVELGKAIEQFLTTLISSDSKFDRSKRGGPGLSFDEMEGERLFNTENRPDFMIRGADCFHCHGESGLLFTNNEFFNNGLDDNLTDLGLFLTTGKVSDKGKFKAPSLRNLAFSAPYMHDGRFKTLDEVLDFYGDHVQLQSLNIDPLMKHSRPPQIQFNAQEKEYLKAFLNTLNDYTFISNPEFSNPFKN